MRAIDYRFMMDSYPPCFCTACRVTSQSVGQVGMPTPSLGPPFTSLWEMDRGGRGPMLSPDFENVSSGFWKHATSTDRSRSGWPVEEWATSPLMGSCPSLSLLARSLASDA